MARLEKARIPIQVDIGFGYAVTPDVNRRSSLSCLIFPLLVYVPIRFGPPLRKVASDGVSWARPTVGQPASARISTNTGVAVSYDRDQLEGLLNCGRIVPPAIRSESRLSV